MSNSMLSLIFPLHGIDKLSSNNETNNTQKVPETKSLQNSMILFGEANNVYRTSLLFQACLSAATSKREAVFISKDKFNTLPLFVHNMPKPDADLLKLIQFKYFYKYEQIIEYFSKLIFEKSSAIPSLIVLDDIISFFDLAKVENELDCVRQAAMICAHAQNVLTTLNAKFKCSLIVSCRNLEKDHYFKMYFNSFAYLKVIEKDSYYQIDFTEKENNNETKVGFKIKSGTLFLDALNDEEFIANINDI